MPNHSLHTNTDPPRYTRRPFPPYRYLPFQAGGALPHPHPRTDPGGHSFNADEDYLPHFTPDDWPDCEPYLYGIDLFNHGYWWEAHDALEAVWLAAGARETRCGIFVQGLIQLAVAQLKRVIDSPGGAQSLTVAACEKLAGAEEFYLGIEVAPLMAEAQRCLREDCGEFPRIVLHFPDPEPGGQ
ncbi:MAG: DUF309 domain-containing protein [Desulfuromonadales bacterium]|nr:DUF309 domain-containing protein [Desulfuromonadales bacterium]